ncbi:hypothetical protein FRC04_002898 [Tulasnella sp. 424]|nr:hypothetical protein FRC04_002898 [Tulasnella sp. 424]KAG8981250.1 hypothetical protein FRC05_004152 [Tulasnella sp. 425]
MASTAFRSTQPANAKLRYSRATTPLSAPAGHHSTSETPAKFLPVPTKANEEAPEIDAQLISELQDNIILVKPEKFMGTFMYNSESSRLERDKALAEDCFNSLQSRQEEPKFNKVVKDMLLETSMPKTELLSSLSTYSEGEFKRLVTDVNLEKELYRPLVTLLTYINSFFRLNFRNAEEVKGWSAGIDKGWERATGPKEEKRSMRPKPGSFLQRRFVVTNRDKGEFSNHIIHGPELLPDLCLVLHDPTPTTKGHNTKPERLFWKNVKVPIEVKLSDGLDAATACQMARYTRAIKLEQFDRNVVFSLLLSKRNCWIFHWDAAGCHTTKIDVHKNPSAFIQVIGRLASMSPKSMGYDAQFSNAGRVLAGEEFKTVLEVSSGRAKQFLDESSGDNRPEKVIKLDLFVDNPIFEARGLLFSRFTRIWAGRELQPAAQSSPGPLRVVKQNWADGERISEAFLYDQAKDVPSIARVLGSQKLEGTAEHHEGIRPDDVIGVYRAVKGSNTNDISFRFQKGEEMHRLFERVLVRMVFEQKGRSIFRVQSCRELLQATEHWVEGLQGLHEKGIIHRDISSGNLLLGQDPNSRAFIIDLGLAYFNPEDERNVSGPKEDEERDARDHHHLTGTLPFIAHEIIEASRDREPIPHTFYHDLESLFWVLLYLVLLKEPSQRAINSVHGLQSTQPQLVYTYKKTLLCDDLESIRFSGRFKDLGPFLKDFGQACWDHHKKKRSVGFEDIIKMVDLALESLPPSSREATTVVPDSEYYSGQTKRKRGDNHDEANHLKAGSAADEVEAQQNDEAGEGEGSSNYASGTVGSGRVLRRRRLY